VGVALIAELGRGRLSEPLLNEATQVLTDPVSGPAFSPVILFVGAIAQIARIMPVPHAQNRPQWPITGH